MQAAPVFNEQVHGGKVPLGWDKQPRFATRSQLLAHRHRQDKPDPSFDLDNDGFVSQFDMKLSHAFDRNADGKLDAKEKANAINHLHQNRPQRFVLGEAEAPTIRPISADESQLQGTMAGGKAKTRSELLRTRRTADVSTLDAQHTIALRQQKEKYYAFIKETQPIKKESGSPGKVWSKICAERKRDKREIAGLLRDTDIVNKNRPSSPKMGHQQNPLNPTRTALHDRRFQETMGNLDKSLRETAQYFKPSMQRLQEREDAQYLERDLVPAGASRAELMASRKSDFINAMARTFGKDKAPENNQWATMSMEERPGFWTVNKGWVERPLHDTQSSMKIDTRFWLREEPEDGPAAPTAKPGSLRGTLKRSSINEDIVAHVQCRPAPKREATNMFPRAPQDGSIRTKFGDEAECASPEALASAELREATAPLYSSFSVTKEFNPPRLPKAKPFVSTRFASVTPVKMGMSRADVSMRPSTTALETRPIAQGPRLIDTLSRSPRAPLQSLSRSMVRSAGFGKR